MFSTVDEAIGQELEAIRREGTYKNERVIVSPQGAEVAVDKGSVINLCANNYLGLADHPDVIAAAKSALDTHGFGMSSVRFICGTTNLHTDLEKAIARFHGTEDAVLYSSCFDANGGLFEALLTKDDAVISDALNHASIIDGIRLSKAARYRFPNSDMDALEACLKQTAGARRRLIATDGVFSMDGYLAKLDQICLLAEQYDAMVMVDDSHATGYIGPTGRGTPEHFGVEGRVDIITSTLGKALGGASGGYTTGPKKLMDLLRQRSRPYLFSNTLTPALAAAGIRVFEMLSAETTFREKLLDNTRYLRLGLKQTGFDLIEGETAIVPVMLYDAKLAGRFADLMLKEGVYVVGFSYPVVPKEKARIRVQLSAAHERKHLDQALRAFTTVGKALNVI
jgi:glycine C-acetyltransferase